MRKPRWVYFLVGFSLTFLSLTLARVVLSAQNSDHREQLAPEQPLPYSHKTHLALGVKCLDCHVNPEPGEKMTYPATSRCMVCHRTVAKEKPSIQKLAAYSESNQPIPWVRVYAVSAGTYWSHRIHLQADLKCDQCHGDVARMVRIEKVRDVTSMAGCVECHKQYKAGTGCEFCHEGK
jgi:hypothetical protein